MIKPFPTHDSGERDSPFSRRPILLAKLPHVGLKADRGTDPTTAATPGRGPLANGAPVETLSTTHLYVDHSHPVSEAATVYPQTPEFNQSRNTPSQAPAPTTYHRHDDTHPASQRSHRGRGSRRRSGGIMQVQNMISSHSGLIVTLALTACAVLLLLTIVNPPEPQLDPHGDGYDLYGSRATEVPHFDHGGETAFPSIDEPVDEPLDLFASNSAEEPPQPLAADQEEIDLFGWDDAFLATQETSAEQLSVKPVESNETAPAALEELPKVDDEPIAESELEVTDPTATNYPLTTHPELDLSFLIEISEQHLTTENPVMTELPTVPTPGTLNR